MMRELTDRREYLLVRGRLMRDDTFVPRRCGSTTSIHRWPEAAQPDHGDVFAETLDAEGRVLRTEMPRIKSEAVCDPAPTWRVRVYLPLDDEAAEVRLRRGDVVLWTRGIGEAPNVEVELVARPTRGKRGVPGEAFPGGRPAVLALDRTRAADGATAYAKVIYRWAEGQFAAVYLGPARAKISIPADRLPGGRRCEFFVAYSDGVRSAVARTDPIAVEPIGPVITVVHPAEGARFTVGAPVELECVVQDPEHPSEPAREPERTQWWVDGEAVGSGTRHSAGMLTEGEHRIEVRHRGSDRRDVVVGRTVMIAPARVAPASERPDRDPFAD
jgi:hypothetical protein